MAMDLRDPIGITASHAIVSAFGDGGWHEAVIPMGTLRMAVAAAIVGARMS